MGRNVLGVRKWFEKGRDQMDKIRVKKIHDEKAAVTLEINESIHTKTDGFKKDENGLYLNEGMGDEAIKHKRNEGFNASDRSERVSDSRLSVSPIFIQIPVFCLSRNK